MTSSTKLKEDFDVESKYGAFYTGGNVEWIESTLYCQTTTSITLLDIDTGCVKQSIGEPESDDIDFIQTFTIQDKKLVTSHKSGLLKLWNINGEQEKMWKYIHKGPIAKLCLRNDILASGGSDSIVRIWNMQHQACTLSLKGCQGVIDVLEFHPNDNGIFASGDDGKINYYSIDKGELLVTYDAHYSKVTCLAFASNNKNFVSSGRDKVLILWEYNKNDALKTIAVDESIEAIISLPPKTKLPCGKLDSELYIASAGENGVIKIWDIENAKEVYVQKQSLVSRASEPGGLAITKLLYNKSTKSVAVITVEHNIIIHHLKSFVCLKQFVGFSDEILDIAFVGENDSYIAVATNSNDIKLYCNSTMSCQLLKGHTDIVLALNTSKTNPNLMLSSGKDNTIRLWLFDDSDKTMTCVGTGLRHTGSVESICFAQTSTDFAASVSQDTCVKVWEIPKKLPTKDQSLSCKYTEIAHQKDINCVMVSPNDKIIATASQDKTAKLWTDSLTLVGVLRGHKRGVWFIRFSPVDQVVITSSADCTIKLWNILDLSCLKTIQGHESSVLRVEFISRGMQILSAGADGLVKLHNLKTLDCVKTFDQHDGKVWALTIKSNESGFITGGSDSLLIKWKDVTEQRKLEHIKEAEEIALQEQQLSNYLQNENLSAALKLCLKLNKPFQTLKVIQGIIKKGNESILESAITSLDQYNKDKLMDCAVTWNMNSKHCAVAQRVINILLQQMRLDRAIETALPYTERHLRRLTQLLQDMYFVDYTLQSILGHAK